MPNIAERLTRVREAIQSHAHAAGRNPAEITLVAVSKTKPAETIRAAFELGQRDFGENYLQESIGKIEALKDLPIVWHFLGPVQSNKSRPIAEHFDWVHTVDRLKLAERFSVQRPATLAPLNLCLQVNIDAEASKAGCTPQETEALAKSVARLPNLRLRGLMAIPAPGGGHRAFPALAKLMMDINRRTGLDMDMLSMGMSDDLGEAIAAGATLVRVGTAVFGARDYNAG